MASVPYNQVVPGFDVLSEGYTLVDIDAPTTYKFERIFVSTTPTATSSKLAPRSSMLVPTESGGFMFAASLDGLGTALLEWNNGQLLPVCSLPAESISQTDIRLKILWLMAARQRGMSSLRKPIYPVVRSSRAALLVRLHPYSQAVQPCLELRTPIRLT